jgi:hypothetical protein
MLFILDKSYSSYGHCAIHEKNDLRVRNAVLSAQGKDTQRRSRIHEAQTTLHGQQNIDLLQKKLFNAK